jgi:ligand-binding sensor domain-containing protein
VVERVPVRSEPPDTMLRNVQGLMFRCREARHLIRRHLDNARRYSRTGSARAKGARTTGVARTAMFLLACLLYANQGVALDAADRLSQYGHTAWRLQDGYFGGTVTDIAQTQDGYIWVGTGSGLFKFDGVRVVPWHARSAERLSSAGIQSLLGAKDGSLWIGADFGLFRLRGDEVISYFEDQAWLVSRILEDRNGNIWVTRLRPGDRTHPLCQVGESTIRCYGKEDGVDATGVDAIVQDASGTLWVGSSTTIVKFQPGAPVVYRPPALQSNDNNGGVQAMARAPDGTLWVGMMPGRGAGLEHMVNGVLQPVVTPHFDSESLG